MKTLPAFYLLYYFRYKQSIFITVYLYSRIQIKRYP